MNGKASLFVRVAVTVAIGLAGGLIAHILGVPVAPLIGSSIAVSAVSWFGLKTRSHTWVTTLAFALVGTGLGSGFTPDIINDVVRWPVSLVLLLLSVAATQIVGALVLIHAFRLSRATGILASSPGALSFAVALASEERADMAAVLSIQSMRLLLIVVVLPLIIGLGADFQPQTLPQLAAPAEQPMSYPLTAALLVGALMLGWLLARLSFPAAYFLAALGLSGVLHATGAVQGTLAEPLIFAGLMGIGVVIGSRFSAVTGAQLLDNVVASFAVVIAASGIAAAFAIVAARITDLPFGQVWVAFAPGGLEATTALSLALGYDSAYVATHHVIRILLLVLTLPLVLRRFRDRTPD